MSLACAPEAFRLSSRHSQALAGVQLYDIDGVEDGEKDLTAGRRLQQNDWFMPHKGKKKFEKRQTPSMHTMVSTALKLHLLQIDDLLTEAYCCRGQQNMGLQRRDKQTRAARELPQGLSYSC